MSDVSLPDWAECLLTQGPRYTILHGGRGSAKSMSVGTALPIRAAAAPLRVLCCREIQQSIQESVKSMLESRMRAMDLAGSFYDIQKSEINGANGSKFIFRGL